LCGDNVVTPLSGADDSKIAHRGEALPGSIAGEAFGGGSADMTGNWTSNLLGVLDFDSI
jgi:hypothetical protein